MCILLFWMFPFQAKSQVQYCPSNDKPDKELYFRHLTKEDGLPSPIVRCCVKDPFGYIWLGTDNGLVKYDGTEMKIFRYVPGDTSSLSESSVHTLMIASDSCLWIGTKNGLSVYDLRHEQFRNFQDDSQGGEAFPGDWILSFHEDRQGIVWIGTDRGIVRTDPETMKFNPITLHRNEIPLDRENLFRWVNYIAADPRDPAHLLLATRGGLLLFDTRSGQIIGDYDENQDHLYRCETLFVDDQLNVWTGEWNTGLKKLNLSDGSWQIFSPAGLPLLNINNIEPKSDHELWIGTMGQGLGVFDTKNHSFKFYKHREEDPKSISSNWLHGNLLTNRESLWALSETGINISDPEYRSFIREEAPFPLSSITGFLYDGDEEKLYVTGAGCRGLYFRDQKTGNWGMITPEKVIDTGKFRLSGILKDHNGIIYTGSSEGLLIYNRQKERLSQFVTASGETVVIEKFLIHNIYEDSRFNLWLGTLFEGVVRIDSSRNAIRYFTPDPMQPGSIMKSQEYKAIREDSRGRIWVGCYDGVSVFDPSTGVFDLSVNDLLRQNGIRKGVIWGIESDSLGRIYLSVDDEGLVRIDGDITGNPEIRLFHLNHGINDLNLYQMERDRAGNLYIINEGVTILDPYGETFRVIDTRNGLHSNKNWVNTLYIDCNDNLYLDDGTAFETKNISHIDVGSRIENLLVESVEVNGQPRRMVKHYQPVFSLHLDPGKNNLLFRYKAICFYDIDHVRYKYLLEGFDNEWRLAGNSTIARYTNLAPGDYVFRLRALHRGIEFDRQVAVELSLAPYLWQRSWFILLSIAVVLAVLYGLYRLRTRQMLKEERIKGEFRKKLADLEMQALRAQMNPHFIFNSLNSINNFILKNETEEASDFLVKFSRLVRQVLNNSNHKMVSLTDELKALKLYIELEQMRFENRFGYSIEVPYDADPDRILLPPLILQPYVENAIWHGLMHNDSKGRIDIRIEPKGEKIEFRVHDNGIGREKAATFKSKYDSKGKSLGMGITGDRIRLMKDLYNLEAESKVTDLYDNDGTPAGTLVVITIPLIIK